MFIYEVINEILTFASNEEYSLIDLTFSPITGGEGNIEFLAHLGWMKEIAQDDFAQDKIEKIVEDAHSSLKNKNIKKGGANMNKIQRHLKIRELISENEIETQDELVDLLKALWEKRDTSNYFTRYQRTSVSKGSNQ